MLNVNICTSQMLIYTRIRQRRKLLMFLVIYYQYSIIKTTLLQQWMYNTIIVLSVIVSFSLGWCPAYAVLVFGECERTQSFLCNILPSVESTFSHAAAPPSTSSTSFNFGYFLLLIWIKRKRLGSHTLILKANCIIDGNKTWIHLLPQSLEQIQKMDYDFRWSHADSGR